MNRRKLLKAAGAAIASTAVAAPVIARMRAYSGA